MAIDVSYRDGFETSAKDLSRLNKNIFRNSGVHTDSFGALSTKLQVTQQSVPNMTVQVLEGEADFYGADVETMYTFRIDTTENVTITPATHTVAQTRVDIIILKVDSTTNIATIEAVAGTPATTGSQVVPTTPSSSYKLAEITIVGGLTAITNALITDRRNPINIYSRNSNTGWNWIYQAEFIYNDTQSIKTTSAVDLTSMLSIGDKIQTNQVTTGITYWQIQFIDYNSTVANRTYIKFTRTGYTNNTINSVEYSKNLIPSGYNYSALPYLTPQGVLQNGYIDVSVTSNNLTVRILNSNGQTPSLTNPVFVNIAGTMQRISSVLSITRNAGTNWLNSGSAELATQEIDYFVYIGFNTSTGNLNIGLSRIPSGRVGIDFSFTNTDSRGIIFSETGFAATDNVVNTGRFAATLSAGAGYTWSVPTFTNANLIQEPMYESRELTSTHTITWSGGTTSPSTTTSVMRYQVIGNKLKFNSWFYDAGTGAKNRTNANIVLPFSFNSISSVRDIIAIRVDSGGSIVANATAAISSGNNFNALVSMTTAAFELYTSGEITI
jgi:hypothetical protein